MNGVIQITSVSKWSNDFTSYLLLESPHLKVSCEHTGHFGFSVTIRDCYICNDKIEFRAMVAFVFLLFVLTCAHTAYIYSVITAFEPEKVEAVRNLFEAYTTIANASTSIYMPTSSIPSTAKTFMHSSFHAPEL